MRIKMTYPASEFVLRQTPGSRGSWAGCDFILGDDEGVFDGWVVYEYLPRSLTAQCDPQRTVFITGEPASVRKYDRRFLEQFAAVITPQRDLDHSRVLCQQPAIPWWVGVAIEYQPAKQSTCCRLDYDQLKASTVTPKEKLLSVICSNKTQTEGHRERLELLNHLVAHFGSNLDVFGHGFRSVTDKWDAIHPYKYHIVLENVRAEHYWTEKIADTFLASAFPLYCGCPNLHEYFPKESFRAINRNDPQAAIAAITSAIENDIYGTSLPFLSKARELVLDEYNVFPMVVRELRKLPKSKSRKVTLRPECDFVDPLPRRIKRRLRQVLLGH